MDDYLDSFDNLDEVITTVHNVTPFLTFGSFNLATFISSNRITLKNLSREILLSKAVNLDLEELLTYRMLVKRWDAIMNMLKFKASNKVVLETKSGVLSAISSVFDPLELIDPVNCKIKLIIPELWRRGLNQDTKIPDNLREWNIWSENVIKLSLLIRHAG